MQIGYFSARVACSALCSNPYLARLKAKMFIGTDLFTDGCCYDTVSCRIAIMHQCDYMSSPVN